MTCELRMAVGGLGTVAPLLTLLRRPSALLPRLVYLMLCRSIQLLGTLARGKAAKDLHESTRCPSALTSLAIGPDLYGLRPTPA
jgi:hypothetical protein